MHKKFNSGEIENKWQQLWREQGLYTVGERNPSQPKEYVLVEWPYPSGNLHIGHWYAFAVPDIYARFKRMTGHQVLYPMGFDAFGLPAENAAIKRGLDPKAWTNDNIAYMRAQLERMGNSFAWDKTANSTDQSYYKWTQWMFTQFFEKGIAYRGKGIVNWCPGCNTVIANEQVLANGTCERSGDVIEKREMPQWMMKITDYADRLTDDLDALDWPEHIKEAQRQWIGRSRGAKINFTLSTGDTVTVFTTRPDTLFGATYLVLSPEHSLIQSEKVRCLASNLGEVDAYVAQAKQKDEQDRLDATKEKTGVQLDGITATNPASGEEIHVYIADYVLGGYGTGAIMAVPAHDERDNAFAKKFDIPIKQVVAKYLELDGVGKAREGLETLVRDTVDLIIEHPSDGTFLIQKEADGDHTHVHFVGGGTEGEADEVAIARELLEETGFTNFDIVRGPITTTICLAYRHTKNKNQLTKSSFYHLKLKDLNQVPSEIEEGKHTIEWAKRESIAGQLTWNGHADGWDVFLNDTLHTGNGILINSAIKPTIIFNKKENIEHHRTGVYGLIRNQEGRYLMQFFPTWNYYWLPGGGVEADENEITTLKREILEETGYGDITIGRKISSPVFDYVRQGTNVNGRNYCHVYEVHLESTKQQPLNLTADESADKMETRWMSLDELIAQKDVDQQRSALIIHCIQQAELNNEDYDGMDSEEAKEKIVAMVDGEMTATYRIRDWSIGRQRYWGVPIPIVYDPQGVAHVVPKEHLPWILPEDVDFKPTGIAPLAKSESLKQRTIEIFGEGWTPEVETMDTFVDSSWYFLRYLDNQNEGGLASLERQREWMPIDIYFGGAEHTTMHLLYSRFWQKALFDLGLVTESEPYRRRINRGLILGPDGNKMSKSKGNVIDPDTQVAIVGADTIKMYLAFMGPYEGGNYPWDMGGIAGLRRFLERSYGLVDHVTDTNSPDVARQLHKTISKVTSDISEFKFNTAISAMMIFVNLAEKEGLTRPSFESFIKILAPFAPHITEEIWHELGYTTSIHHEAFPVADPELARDTTVVIGVQINGKLRGDVTTSPRSSEAEVLVLVQQNPVLKTRLANAQITKVIYIPGKIINLIIPS